MKRVYAGTSGWAYSTWKPDFYPRKLGSTKFLDYYATRLNSVEVNYTFRTLPTKELLRRWIEATPHDFKFAVKAHQEITHFKRLRNATGAAAKFISSLRPLADANKLGPILFQLNPNMKCDLPLLKDFLAGLPRRFRYAFEFRNASWFNDEVYAALRKSKVALCLAESDVLETPHVQTASYFYLRLRKEKYSAKARMELSARVARLARRGEVFAFFMHQDFPEGALYAEKLLAAPKPKQ